MPEKVSLPVKTAHYLMKKGRVFVSVNVFHSTFLLKFLAFFGIKTDTITVTKLAPILDGTWSKSP